MKTLKKWSSNKKYSSISDIKYNIRKILIFVFLSEMNAEEVEEKQQFMREEILEKGYDPEDFIEFLHQHISSDGTRS